MQTQGGQLLKYRVQIFFEVLGGFRGQQHSLKLWDSVRRLERKINTKDTMIISQKNQINVNNVEVNWVDIWDTQVLMIFSLCFAYAANIGSVLYFQNSGHR